MRLRHGLHGLPTLAWGCDQRSRVGNATTRALMPARRVLRRPAPGRRVRPRNGLPGLRPRLEGQLLDLRGRHLVGRRRNWYWDDDYFADGDDERRHFEDWHDDEEKKASTVGYVKSADPFAVEPDEDTGAATLLVTALLVTGALLGCCARRPRGQRRPLCRAEGQRKSRLGAGVVGDDARSAPGREAAAFFTMSFPPGSRRRPTCDHAGRDPL